jgi:single-strand DNA-binding protein
MADLNHVVLVGRLTRDAELKYTTNGFPISTFSLAINRRRKNGEQWVEEANFFDITLYGKSAESLKAYLVKGKQIALEGELRQDRWEQDGQPRSKVVISANNIQLLGGGNSTGGGAAGSYGSGASGGYNSGAPGGSGAAGSAPPRQGAAPGGYGSGNVGGGFTTPTVEEFSEDIPF